MKIRPIFEGNKKKKPEPQKAAQAPAPGRPSFLSLVVRVLTRKETISLFLVVLFLAVALTSVFIRPQLYQRKVHEGDISLKDVYAPYDFTYFWGFNEEQTEEARETASKAVPFVVRRDIGLERDTQSRLEKFFDALEEEKVRDASIDEKVAGLKEKTGTPVEDKSLKVLLGYEETEKLREGTSRVTDNILVVGLIKEKDLEFLEKGNVTKVSILNEEDGTEIERTTEGLLDKSEVQKTIGDYASKQFPKDKKIRQAVEELVARYAALNLELDEKRTLSRREATVKKVAPVYNAWSVKKNELIIEKGERVNARHIAQLMQLRSVFREGKPTAFFVGILLLFLLLALYASVYMKFVQQVNFLQHPKGLAIVLLNMLFMIVVADAIIRGPQPSYFIPLASMAMVIKLLLGFNPAFLSATIMSILIAVLAGGKVEVALVLLTGSLAGMYAIRDARRRATILWAGLLVGIAKLVAVICVDLVNGIEMTVVIKDGLWGMSSGIISGFIVLGLLPLFEHFFKVPTNISLLELSDLNHPILKELAIEAPGTYHHSILVGNLAEAACDNIGANSLLARVGSYYHDIGKIAKASYYSENEMGAGSRHAKLTPSMSALIISKHVKEGLEVAKKYKLNTAILDFITQHHGNSLISFFYQKALEKAEGDVVPKEENFRYPGPRPQTKETAIVLLADAVEAASRTLDEPTPSSIRNLVKKIINNKFVDGQLDECDLTLQDIHKIAESFSRVLMGIFHTRLDYPEEGEEKKEKAPDADKDKLQKPKQQEKD
ncbi:MAG: HD family phosphohydrolase [Candidatus Omnitrophota bacterium]